MEQREYSRCRGGVDQCAVQVEICRDAERVHDRGEPGIGGHLLPAGHLHRADGLECIEDINAGFFKFRGEKSSVEGQVVSDEMRGAAEAFKELREQIAERRSLAYIGVGDAMNGGGDCRYKAPGIDQRIEKTRHAKVPIEHNDTQFHDGIAHAGRQSGGFHIDNGVRVHDRFLPG